MFKVGDLIEVANVDDSKVLDTVVDAIEDFILSHALGVPVAAKADDDKALLLHDGLVDVPPSDEMGKHYGTRDEVRLDVLGWGV